MKIEKKPIPFRYPGGKFYALNILAPYWLDCPHDEYREPFVGGGSVFFTKELCKHNILNDIDSELITTYRIFKDENLRLEFLNLLNNEVATKERWQEIFKSKPKNQLEIAYKYYYLNRTSFSGKLSSPAWGYREKRSLPPERWNERIKPCGSKLKEVDILNKDFAEIISLPRKGESTLIFVDPPYFKPSKNKHYRYGFNLEDHIRLATSLKETEHKFFLTYDDTPEVRELYSWANIRDINFTYRVDNSAVQNGTRNLGFELIISNFELIKKTLF